MPDEPTLGELARRFEDQLGYVREDIQQLVQLVDKRVSTERYQIEKEAREERDRQLVERVKALEEASKEKERQRAADRRLIFSALVVPVLMVLLQVYLSSKGAGS